MSRRAEVRARLILLMLQRRESYEPLLKSFPDSEKINAVSEGAEVLYLRLLARCDDAGRYYGDAKWVLAKLFTSRMFAGQVNEDDVEGRLQELERVGLVCRYSAMGSTFLELLNVFKRLRNDVKRQVMFPQRVTSNVTNAARMRNGRGPLDPVTDPVTDPKESASADSCSEPPQAAASEPAVAPHEEPSEFVFPVTGKGPREWVLSQRKLAEYVEAYPSLDVRLELVNARQWCRDNPQKRKTKTGMLAFLTRWLGKAVNEVSRGRTHERGSARHNSGRRGEVRDRSL